MSEICPPQYKPRKKPVDTHKILKSDGTMGSGAIAPLTDEQSLEALRLMMLGRAFDTKCFSLQRQGKMGTFAPLHGQEASIVGSAMALNPATDWIAPQYREMPAAVRQGLPLENIILYRQGHPDGGIIPDGVNVMQFQISLAAQIPHAVGLAWGMQLQQKTALPSPISVMDRPPKVTVTKPVTWQVSPVRRSFFCCKIISGRYPRPERFKVHLQILQRAHPATAFPVYRLMATICLRCFRSSTRPLIERAPARVLR